MKIDAISKNSYAFKGQPQIQNEAKNGDVNYDYAYLYDNAQKKTINVLSLHKKEYLAGFFAFLAAIYCIMKFAGRNTTPKNVVELFGNGIGLNRIESHRDIVKLLKDQILYPIMSVDKGHTSLLRDNKFKTGLIVGGEDAKEVASAFIEHAKALGIECLDVRAKGGNIHKEVNKVISNALQMHAENRNKCVIVNIGDIGAFSKLRSSKTNPESNIERRLENIPKGVLWVGWTENTKKLPYFYNNTPTLYAIIKN